MKTVLCAWELGRGAGHAAKLYKLAKRLEPIGVHLVAAVKTPAALRDWPSDIEIVQTPPWPIAALSAQQLAQAPSASMGDILSIAGLADTDALSALLDWWESLFSRCRPDLLVAEFAPAAGLAARGRVPIILIGSGYSLPPCGMERFPPLYEMAHPHDERITLDVVNHVLKRRGADPLDHLPQIFEADARMVLSFPLFDPYSAVRTEELYGPLLDYEPAAPCPDPQTVFVYLSRGYALHDDIPGCFLSHGRKIRIHAPDLSDLQTCVLRAAGARIERDPIPPTEALARAALVIHFGGNQLASEALLAGVPQLVLSMQIEQWLNGKALHVAGLGRVIPAHDPRRLKLGLTSLLADSKLRATAAAAGQDYRALLKRSDPLATFERHCLALLDGGAAA